jgi:DNA-binding transcriptional LysR family regulator
MIDLSAIDLNLLVAFEALYAERSVTGAAQRIHMGQPAMSAALGRLRSLFADDLFVRVGREMKPTAKADAIAPQLLSALQTIRATLVEPQFFDPASSQRAFTIATSDYLANSLLPMLLGILNQQAPHIDIRLTTVEKESFITLLEDGIIDLALGTFTGLPKQILEQPLLQERFVGVCCLQHPAIKQKSISLDDFVQFPHALFTLRQDAIGIIDQLLAKQELQRRIALTIPYWFVLPSAITTSNLLAAIPSCLQPHFVKNYPLQSFEIPLDLPSWTISMTWSKLKDHDSANVWLRQIVQHICQQIWTEA